MRDTGRGLIFGMAACTIWGLFPLYWPLVDPTPALQILAHRMVWSLVFVACVLVVRRRWAFVAALRREPRRFWLLTLAAVLISVNWGVFIWGVNSGHVIETSLGYFVNPLVSIALGVLVLKETLRLDQWVAVGIGTVAVLVIGVDYGRLPWIALTLAATFGSYGLVKKLVATQALESLAVETAILAPPALAYLLAMNAVGRGTFGHTSMRVDLLLVGAGAVTAVPLLFFAAATRRVPLTIVGLLQYLTPTLQFVIGVYVRHEPLPGAELAGFGLVWLALLMLGAGEVAQWRRRQREAAPTLDAFDVVETP